MGIALKKGQAHLSWTSPWFSGVFLLLLPMVFLCLGSHSMTLHMETHTLARKNRQLVGPLQKRDSFGSPFAHRFLEGWWCLKRGTQRGCVANFLGWPSNTKQESPVFWSVFFGAFVLVFSRGPERENNSLEGVSSQYGRGTQILARCFGSLSPAGILHPATGAVG